MFEDQIVPAEMWMLCSFFMLQIFLDFSRCVSLKTIGEQCLQNYLATAEVKSMGILYNDDTSTHITLNLIAKKGISSAIRQIPVEYLSDVVTSITAWKAMGIDHVLFLQGLNAYVLQLWLQILDEICDHTWWLFYGEESIREEFEVVLSKRNCITNHWFVCPENCSSSCDDGKDSYWNTEIEHIYHNLTNVKYSKERQKIKGISPKHIRLAVNESPPYLTLNETEDGEIYLAGGPDADILRTVAKKLDFEYKILKSPDGEWGRIRSGNWTGLIGMLSRNEADITAGSVTLTYTRYQASSFTFPYDIQKSVIITRIPDRKPKTYAILLPLKLEVWVLILVALFVFLFLFYGIGIAYEVFYLRRPYKINRILWYLIGSACSEGGWLTFAIQGPAAVLLLALWLLFVLVMQASYCGTLMTVLTFPSNEPSIDTLADLAKAISKKGYECGCMKGTINCDTMLDLQGNLKVIAMSLNFSKQHFVRSVEAGLNKVLEEKFAFLGQEIGCIYKAQLMPDPHFHMSDEGLDIELFAFGARHGFPYLKDIDDIILRLSEAGLIAKWRDDIISLNNMQFSSRKGEITTMTPLTLEELTGAIYLFSYGLVFAVIAFVFENIDGRCLNKQEF